MKGRLAIIAAAILWSTSGFFVKSPTLSAIEPVGDRGLLIACWRCFFAVLALLPLLVWQGRHSGQAGVDPGAPGAPGARAKKNGKPEEQIKVRAMAMARSGRLKGWLSLVAFFAAMNLLFVAAMTRAPAGDVIFLQYMAPLWVLIGGYLLLRERPVRTNLVALGFGLAGVLIIVQASIDTDEVVGALLALGAGVAYAGVILSLRQLKEEDPVKLITVCLLASWLSLLPFALPATARLEATQWAWIAALGLVQMAAPYVIFAWGLKSVTAQEGALITLLEPVLNPLWVRAVWGAAISAHTIVGGGLILAGLILRCLLGEGNGNGKEQRKGNGVVGVGEGDG